MTLTITILSLFDFKTLTKNIFLLNPVVCHHVFDNCAKPCTAVLPCCGPSDSLSCVVLSNQQRPPTLRWWRVVVCQ